MSFRFLPPLEPQGILESPQRGKLIPLALHVARALSATRTVAAGTLAGMEERLMKTSTGFLSTVAALLFTSLLRGDDAEFQRLRSDFARRFCEAAPHISLAKYHHARGNKLLAFGILERARARFSNFDPEKGSASLEPGPAGQQSFEQAFEVVFFGKEPLDTGPEAEAALLKALAKEPSSVEALQKIADIHISRKEWPKAEFFLRKLVAQAPDDFEHFAALASVLHEAGREDESQRMASEFLRRHPETKEGYGERIRKLMEGDRPAARKLLEEALKKFPDVGGFHFELGVILQDEGKLGEAERSFTEAADLDPESDHIQGWVGRFFLKVRKDPAKALRYYLNVYFLDPHFYDTEYAEQRIRGLSGDIARGLFAERRKAGAKLEALLHDENPVLVGIALTEIRNSWRPELGEHLVALLGHEHEVVRWKATEILMDHADATFEPTLSKLLADPDHVKRGLGAYIAVRLKKENAFPELTRLAAEDSQILRYDAYSALVQFGGNAGRNLARQLGRGEKHPVLKGMIASLDRKEEE